MYLSIPRQALCSDRTRITHAPNPDNWLLEGLPAGWTLHRFHYFVDWSNESLPVGDEVWMTLLLHFDADESPGTVTETTLREVFQTGGWRDEFDAINRLCDKYGQHARIIALPEIPESNIGGSTPVWTSHDGRKWINKPLSDLQELIRRYYGGSVRVGKKGLIYGTSSVECYLSHTDSAYPGDVDAVIADDGIARGVVEYKKHTISDRIENHLANKYYPRPDGRKYRRLFSLVSKYRNERNDFVPFVMLYFSTRAPEILLQVIGGLNENELNIIKQTKTQNIGGRPDGEVARAIIEWLEVDQ